MSIFGKKETLELASSINNSKEQLNGAFFCQAKQRSEKTQAINPNFTLKCTDCKKPIVVGDFYLSFAVAKARTAKDRLYAERGYMIKVRCINCSK